MCAWSPFPGIRRGLWSGAGRSPWDAPPCLLSGSSSGEMEVLSVGSFLHELIIFFLMLCVPGLDSARFSVIGPDHPVTAVVGGHIVLPCHLSPNMSVENMEVRWFRHELTPFVHLYRHGEEEFGQQMPEYRDRTVLLTDGIADGNVDLVILNVRPSDEGQYRCSVQDGDFQEEAVLELEVAVSGSAPQISMEGYQDGGILMVCHLAGWYPEPEVLWRDLSGQLLSSSVETKSRDAQGLFEIKSSLVVTERSNQNVSCSVRSARFSLEKDPSTFYMSDSFFPRASPWMVGWSVTLVILLPFVCLACFLFRLTGKIRTELEWRRALRDADVAGWNQSQAGVSKRRPSFRTFNTREEGRIRGELVVTIQRDSGSRHGASRTRPVGGWETCEMGTDMAATARHPGEI
ncbi:butyrophilin subfamily 3 member A2-like isoform X2 [Pelodiscus sinensis]|uniref:butyrophilin subfamily 3 member A2-like isoform X2 n=1 Tax=Pelodiscus sinensis TaxID=13735 RepID=UPI003F6D11AC